MVKKVYLALLACLLAGSASMASAELDQSYKKAQGVLNAGPSDTNIESRPLKMAQAACNPDIESCPPPSACNPDIESCGNVPSPRSCNPDIEPCGNFPPIQPPMCTALGFPGRSLDEAIRICSGPGTPFNAKQCAKQVSCNQGAYPRMCTSRGLPGFSVQNAIENCDKYTDFPKKDCAVGITCMGFGPVCYANGVAGDDVHSAVANCDAYTSMTRSQCAASVFCTVVQPWH